MAVATVPLNAYDHPAYVAASARHEHAVAHEIGGGLTLLRTADGDEKSVYGYPQPSDPQAAADALRALSGPWRVTFAGLGPARELATLLGDPVDTRDLVLARLDGDLLTDCVASRGRRAVRSALKVCDVEIAPLQPETFGPFYRAAMAALDAAPIYRFDDQYFATLTAVPSYVVSVRDEHGVAAAALWVDGEPAASYHLGGRRTTTPAPNGAMHLALLAGMQEAQRRGRALALLGGGRSAAPDDPLLVFKAQLASQRVQRVAFASPPTGVIAGS